MAGGKSLGKVASTKGMGDKKKGARSAKAHVPAGAAGGLPRAKLTEQGRTLLGGCAVEGLRATPKGRKGGRVTPLDRDLGICSVPSENPTAKPYKGPPIDTANSDRCDFLDPAVCLQPWPNDYFTVADPSTDTGRRLNLAAASMPANKAGAAITPTDMNRGDGFSPGNLITVKVPEVSTQAAFQNSGFVPINDVRRFDDDNQPAVVIDAETGERHPIWAELDANAANSADANVIIRPLRNFDEGKRYIVALRGLRNAQGGAVEPPLPFRVYRDRLITQQAPVEGRRAHIEQLISTLQGAGFARSNLYMAWDFTVASEQSLTGRALEIRDDAFAELGDTDLSNGTVEGSSPSFTVTGVLNAGDPVPPGDSALPTGTIRRVDGMITDAPCYLNVDGCAPGATFDFDSGGDLQFNPAFTTDIPFRCFIPESVVQGGALAPAKMATFGHGLLGDLAQVSGQARLGNLHNSVWCATNWAGFSSDDYPNVLNSLGNLANFNKLVDRMQQGFVNFMLLGRALVHDDGFRDDPAFEVDPDGIGGDPAGSILEPTNDLYFEGISQGGIMGGALTALSPDFTRSILNVPAINYSTLLRRSVDFDEYAHGVFFDTDTDLGLYDNYPNEVERPLILSLMQLLWDRGEGNGYAHHMTTDPLPDTPAAPGAAAGGARRPPGRQHRGRGRGADDRGQHLQAGARSRSPLGVEPVHADARDQLRVGAVHPSPGLGPRLLRRRAAQLRQRRRRRGRDRVHQQPALDGAALEHLSGIGHAAERGGAAAAPDRPRRGPARLSAALGGRPPAHRRLPLAGRLHPSVHGPGPGHQALLRERLDGPLGARLSASPKA